MLKKILGLACFAFLSLAANAVAACEQLPVYADEMLRAVAEQNGGWPISEENCALVKRHNAQLDITEDTLVLDGVSVATVTVRLRDARTQIVSGTYRVGVRLNRRATPDVNLSEAMLYECLTEALSAFKFKVALADIRKMAASVAK